MIKRVTLLLLFAATACTAPDAAVGNVEGMDLDGLSRFLFAHNEETADPLVLGRGLVSLETWFENYVAGGPVTSNTPLDARRWTLDPLEDEDVKTLPKRPDRPLSATKGAAVVYLSPHKIECHAALQTIVDARPLEPTAARYERLFLEPTEPACFIDGDCAAMSASDSVRRENPIFWADYTLLQEFRWVHYEKDGVPRRAFVGRSWFEESSDGPDGPEGNQLWQNYHLGVWIERGEQVLRYEVVWTENELYLLGVRIGFDTELVTLTDASEGVFVAGDKHIKDKLIPADACKN